MLCYLLTSCSSEFVDFLNRLFTPPLAILGPFTRELIRYDTCANKTRHMEGNHQATWLNDKQNVDGQNHDMWSNKKQLHGTTKICHMVQFRIDT